MTRSIVVTLLVCACVPSILAAPVTDTVTVDLLSPTTPFDHYWKRSFGSGHAALTLREDWRSHLKLAAQELGLQGVRHHGLLDDDMEVVTAPGVFNFTKVPSGAMCFLSCHVLQFVLLPLSLTYS